MALLRALFLARAFSPSRLYFAIEVIAASFVSVFVLCASKASKLSMIALTMRMLAYVAKVRCVHLQTA
jgi:hypothetical protein